MSKPFLPAPGHPAPRNANRRDFLRKSAGAMGALSAAAMLPASIQRALAIPAAVDTGTIKDVKHVVILMQENRAFNHYFGDMRGVRGFGDRFPIPMASGKSVWYQSDGTKAVPPSIGGASCRDRVCQSL